jgi:hypothetical protein
MLGLQAKKQFFEKKKRGDVMMEANVRVMWP